MNINDDKIGGSLLDCMQQLRIAHADHRHSRTIPEQRADRPSRGGIGLRNQNSKGNIDGSEAGDSSGLNVVLKSLQ